jgi:hypothetical protein
MAFGTRLGLVRWVGLPSVPNTGWDGLHCSGNDREMGEGCSMLFCHLSDHCLSLYKKRFFFFFFFFLALFGFELRALHSLGRCSTT